MAPISDGVIKLYWWDVDIHCRNRAGTGTKDTHCTFLAATELEAQLKGIRFVQSEGLDMISVKVTQTKEAGTHLRVIDQMPPTENERRVLALPAPATVPEPVIVIEDDAHAREEKDLKKHFTYVPINVTTKAYTYKEAT